MRPEVCRQRHEVADWTRQILITAYRWTVERIINKVQLLDRTTPSMARFQHGVISNDDGYFIHKDP